MADRGIHSTRDASLCEYSPRWNRWGDLIRTQMQETGRVRLSFLTLADVLAACSDLGIDPSTVEFRNGYAVVQS